ncbi:hypothetical protein [uncultured Sphingomonas sp.]|uniref:hypothetical protein n=1 Tax=uncultured Sphingomonas sp. TaxID=158754 RepID=UPI002615EDE1|nr:hypothetical protein [uncultured Sphingomonas sp.]
MPIEPPPTRYRVVERGRRLEVIDTHMGGPAAPAMRAIGGSARRPPPKPPIISRTATNGTRADTAFVTMRLYDAKGPRAVRLDDRAFTMLARLRLVAVFFVMAWITVALWQPVLALLPLFLFGRNGPGTAIRRRITNWLDRYAVE